jgi:hypothetical protein
VGGSPKSLSIPDARGNQAYLRVTRHPAERKIVVSHWRQGLCVASTPVELSEVPALISVLAAALGDAVGSAAPAGVPAAVPARTPVWDTVRTTVRDSVRDRAVTSPWWAAPERFVRRLVRPTMAEITVLSESHGRAPGRPRRDGPPG